MHRNPLQAQLKLLRQPTSQQGSTDGTQEGSPFVEVGTNGDDFDGNFGR